MRPAQILRDVVDEHRDEATFLFWRFERALESASFDMNALERSFEARLLAHVDALHTNDPALLMQLPEALRARLDERVPSLSLACDDEQAITERLDAETKLSHPDPMVVASARVTALRHGSREALQRCLHAASFTSRVDAQAMLITALLGSDAQVTALAAKLALDAQRNAALFALGYSGRVALVPTLLSHLDDAEPRTRKLAAEAIGMLTGAPQFLLAERDALTALPPLARDRGNNLVPTPADELPLPNAASLRVWCAEHNWDPHTRTLLGVPWTRESVLQALLSLPMRRRHALGLWLALDSRGSVNVDTRALIRTQRAQLARASGG